MTPEEINQEVLECARYGEEEDLLVLLQHGGDVNFTDMAGNTALHRAAANGEIGCMKVLLDHNAAYLPNKELNTPLHWAVQNLQVEATKFLLENFPQADVLVQNASGKSVLTLAFQADVEELMKLVLAHPSSSEEALDKDAEKTGNAVIDEDGSLALYERLEKHSVTHTMDLAPVVDDSPRKLLTIRELPISRADNPFGSEDKPEDDTTGLAIWPAAVLLGRWIGSLGDALFKGKTVLELGAGAGLPGLAAAQLTNASKVYITDIHDSTLRNAAFNLTLNLAPGAAEATVACDESEHIVSTAVLGPQSVPTEVRFLSWSDDSTFPAEKIDVLIGSDLVYDAKILDLFVHAVSRMLSPDGCLLYVAPITGRDGMAELVTRLADAGIVCTQQFAVPDDMYSNPLVGVDESHFVLHFFDLTIKAEHTFYRFEFAR